MGQRLGVLVAWSAVIWWALTSTRSESGPLFPGSSFVFNLGHAFIFALEALLWGWVLRPAGRLGQAGVPVLASVLALAYAGLLEWRQGFIEGRSSSWIDMLTNAIGAFGLPWVLAGGERRRQRALWVLGLALLSALGDTLA